MPEISQRVRDWARMWENRDADRVAEAYAVDATHSSAVVAQIKPDLGRTELRGREEIRDYARTALIRFTMLRFELLSAVEDANHAAVEYLRHSNIDPANPKHVLELIEWRGNLISAVRVFHF
jgi:hypothetical protein